MRPVMKRTAFPPAVSALVLMICLWCMPSVAGSSPGPGNPSGPAGASLVGTRFGPDMPKGYEEIGGGVMSDETHRMTGYAIQIVRKNELEMAWLSSVTGSGPSGRPVFQIRDVLVLPKRKRGEIVTWFACCSGGRRNDAIIAYTDRYYCRVLRAWVADRQRGKIREVSTGGIVCQDPAAALR